MSEHAFPCQLSPWQITQDEIRSLAISQRLLGTEEIILIHHSDCGILTFTWPPESSTRSTDNPPERQEHAHADAPGGFGVSGGLVHNPDKKLSHAEWNPSPGARGWHWHDLISRPSLVRRRSDHDR